MRAVREAVLLGDLDEQGGVDDAAAATTTESGTAAVENPARVETLSNYPG